MASWLSCHGFVAVLSWLRGSSVMAALSWLPCHGGPVVAMLSPQAVLSWLFNACPFIALLFVCPRGVMFLLSPRSITKKAVL
jgi:hypothetical protein